MKFITSPVVEKMQSFLHPEFVIFFWLLLLMGFIFYKFFLKQISQKRHRNLRERFRTTVFFLLATSLGVATNWGLTVSALEESFQTSFLLKMFGVFVFVVLLLAAISFVKLAQILAYLYLFFMNMSVGVPRLIANLFTFILSLLVSIYLLSEIFSINLTTMIATSAAFSIILGLALQDTLGNLFSGVAMQIGNPFSIGDWVEIQNGTSKWVGQIQEITWRATFITTFSNEWIMIPNKIMTQSQILIFSNNLKQVRQSHTFRFELSASLEKIKTLMLRALEENVDVLKDPEPRVLLIEVAESWLTVKVFYSLEDFSRKYSIGDHIMNSILVELRKENISLASHKANVNILSHEKI